MHISSIALQCFRNIHFAKLELSAHRHFLVGPNGQGKTNTLEALGLITALRSFRQHDLSALIGHGQSESKILYNIQHPSLGMCELEITLKNNTKSVLLNQTPLSGFNEFVGLFPTVVLSSEDIYLLRGTPAMRRRFLDLSLAATDKEYLIILKQYHKALIERNALLRHSKNTENALVAFENVMAPLALSILQKRSCDLPIIAGHAAKIYSLITQSQEKLDIVYKPSVFSDNLSIHTFLNVWSQSRGKDMLLKSTQEGPHRDDFTIKIKGKSAKDYASEGQQRAAVLSLKLAQMLYFKDKSNVLPVVLADDVVGQLDPVRRDLFWSFFSNNQQLICTGTTLPIDTNMWKCTHVLNGFFNF